MKRIYTFLLFTVISLTFAQIPTGYYDGTAGLRGAELKTKLSSIITAGHRNRGYDGLYTGYQTTDRDYFFENDGTVLDMYSENPTGTDPYNFIPGQKKCGNYNSEGDCYNREHVIPQSFFNSNSPMVSDIHFIRPTDGKVNGMRSNHPFGMVTSPTWTSENGGKLGNNTTPGYSGTAFEPINAFKGDIARMVFYFVTRYESQMSNFDTGNMLAKNTYPSLANWELSVLLSWAAQDPVSPEEIARNNASYNFQGNRNPYIDHPEWVQTVWGSSSSDTEAPTAPTNLAVVSATTSSIQLNWSASTDNVSVSSYSVYVNGVYRTSVTGTTANITGLNAGTVYNFYVTANDYGGNVSPQSNTVQGTTLTDTTPPTPPTNLVANGVTSTSVSLTWTASTDAGTITGYDIYVNGVYNSTVTTNSAKVVDLTPSTTYNFYVVAKDSAGNVSGASNNIEATTLAPNTSTTCGSEDFESIPQTNNSSYSTRTWTNNNVTWTATDARTDLKITNNAIGIRNGSLTSSAVGNGISSLTVTTQLNYSGTSGTFTLFVNDKEVGTIPYSSTETTTTVSDINTAGTVTIRLVNNSTSNRVAIDDLSWTCYTALGTNEENIQKNRLTVSPNPVKNGFVQISGLEGSNLKVEIYNISGQLVQTVDKVSKNNNKIQLKNLPKGMYILKAENQSAKFIVE